MNAAPIKQPEVATTETHSPEPQEPHFDEIAVLIAQPVEPIARRERDWFAWLAKPRIMIATLAVAALLGTAALALTLQLPRQRQVDSASTEIQRQPDSVVTETKTGESPAQSKSPLGALNEQLKSTAPRTRSRKPGSSEAKPVARRVGVIVYGTSSDRP